MTRRRRRRGPPVSRKLDAPLTFAAAAVAVEWVASLGDPDACAAGRRLRRLVLRRELEIGHQFALRDAAGDPRWVTLGALARYLPELRPHRMDAIASSLRPMFAEVTGRVEEMVRAEVDRRLAAAERARKG